MLTLYYIGKRGFIYFGIISFKEQYEQLSHTGTAFCEYFERECKCLLDDANIAYYELSFRIKTWDSIVQKIERKTYLLHRFRKFMMLLDFVLLHYLSVMLIQYVRSSIANSMSSILMTKPPKKKRMYLATCLYTMRFP